MEERKSMLSWPLIGVLVFFFLIGGWLLLSTQSREEGPTQVVPGIGGGPQGVSVSNIVSNPDPYIGQTLSLNGEIDRVFNNRAFVLDQEGTIVGDEMLVLTRTDIPSEAESNFNPFNNNDKVMVTGQIRRLNISEIESEIGFDLDPQIENDFRDKPIIIATSIVLNPQSSPASTPTP